MFVHGGAEHLVSNMAGLLWSGWGVERKVGSARFTFVYFFCGVVSLFSYFLSGGVIPTIGASGAIAGVFGAYFILASRGAIRQCRSKYFILYLCSARVFLLRWFLYQIYGLLFLADNVDYLSHVTGFLAGVLLRIVLLKRQNFK